MKLKGSLNEKWTSQGQPVLPIYIAFSLLDDSTSTASCESSFTANRESMNDLMEIYMNGPPP
jgi:hypothetical protein